jgi:hypothetical protein
LAVDRPDVSNSTLSSRRSVFQKAVSCDGVLVSKEDCGPIFTENYAWRGSAWPYGRLHLEFANFTLQGTDKLWLNLSLYIRH